MTRQELFDAMCSGTQVTLHHTELVPGVLISGVKYATTIGRISSIESEDGSGYSFNVKVHMNAPHYGYRMVYVRCPKPTNVHDDTADRLHTKLANHKVAMNALAQATNA